MSYHDELEAMLIKFLKYRIEKSQLEKLTAVAGIPPGEPMDPADRLDITEDGQLTDQGVRQLHEALCRQAGYTSDEIIDYWNKKCPEDPW